MLRNVNVDVLEVVRAGASDLDGGHRAFSSLTAALVQPRQSPFGAFQCGADDAHASLEAAERVARYRPRRPSRRDAEVAMVRAFLARSFPGRRPHLRGYCRHTCCTAAGSLGAPTHSAGRRTDTRYRSGRVGSDRRLTWMQMKVCPPARPPPCVATSLQDSRGGRNLYPEPAWQDLGSHVGRSPSRAACRDQLSRLALRQGRP